MRWSRSWVLVGALFPLGAGCGGHDDWSQRTADTGAAVKGSFSQAYEAVRSGAREVSRYGEYVIDRTGEGMVRVYREVRGETPPAAPDAVSDSAVTASVREALLSDRQLDSRGIVVDTDAGVVTLSGMVPSSQQAARAVEDTTRAHGVYAVNAKLGVGAPPAAPLPTTMKW